MTTHLLLVGILVLLLTALVLLWVLLKRSRVEPRDIELALRSLWQQSGIAETIGRLEQHAQNIERDYRALDEMLRVPARRGAFGEIVLEEILHDELPPDMFAIRETAFDGKKPDAYIRSSAGLICIDSKFPLDNFRRMTETDDDTERDQAQRQFLRDVRNHLEKIARDYIQPAKGTADFAFAFIPSEAVYYFLVTEAYEMLRDYTHRGVQVVSPLTLSHKITLIRAGVHARKLSEEAARVQRDLQTLATSFQQLDQKWRLFYETHFRNANRTADEVDRMYRNLRATFDAISQFTTEDDSS